MLRDDTDWEEGNDDRYMDEDGAALDVDEY